jgi:hypothetical protein
VCEIVVEHNPWTKISTIAPIFAVRAMLLTTIVI